MYKTLASLLLPITLVLTSAAQAATTYNCSGMGEMKGQSVTLTVGATPDQISVDDDQARFDDTYNPRLNLDFSRFNSMTSHEEGTTEYLVQSPLLNGADHGLIKVQMRGEGFGSYSYYCHP